MDPCTQGLLGASLSCSFAKKNELKLAFICGVIGGLAPDLDILIKSENDPLLAIEYHRHFTHSFFFVPIVSAFLASFLFLIYYRNKVSFRKIYFFSTLGVLTHGLLDSCTSYGTMLFWPISNDRVAWNVISIVDPIYSLILLISLLFCLIKKSRLLINVGFICSLIYIQFGFFKYNQIEKYVIALSEKRGHKVERILLNPTIGNNFLWRSVYQYESKYYIDAIYMPLFGDTLMKEGDRVEVIDKENVFSSIPKESTQRKDILRFAFFSQDFIYIHPLYKNVIADLRYGTLPYDSKSLWGIEIDLENNDKHVNFKSLRNFNKENYDEFWDMLKGNL